MPVKNITKLSLKEFLKKKDIKLNQIQSISVRTMNHILKWGYEWKHNKDYRWNLPYFPTESTVSKLSLELDITYEELVKLIENQFKSNKKLVNVKN